VVTSARALAFFVAVVSLINGAASLHGFDGNLWWIDFRPLPAWAGAAILAVSSLLLLGWAVDPIAHAVRRRATQAAVALLIGVAAIDMLRFYGLWHRGAIASGFPMPFSLLVCAVLTCILAAISRDPEPVRWRIALPVLLAAFLLLPLAQIACFGLTDYRRPADACVVLGARAYANGRCSQALADRIRTAAELWCEGNAKVLVMSGAEGDGDVHETEAMRRLAVALGVPDEAILCDLRGVTTGATVANTVPLFRERGFRRVLAVSHAFHLPRVKLTYQAAGFEVFTVPCRETRMLTQMPWLVVRETGALWMYWARAAVGSGPR
jgi:uncharacterized SAM-binding protein YcdF (DUF218 family)